MKNYIKDFAITLLSVYALASFVAWDVTTVITWHPFGRGMLLALALFISAIKKQ